MNKQENLELLNHQLLIENGKLQLQVEVLTNQTQLQEKKLFEQEQILKCAKNLEEENIQLKRDILTLQEQLIKQQEENSNNLSTLYMAQFENLQKENEKDLAFLKKEYQDSLHRLKQEKHQLFEYAIQVGIQNQTAKNLESQTSKIVQTAQKLEKFLFESPKNGEYVNGKSGFNSTREIYDNLINQLNVETTKKHKEQEISNTYFKSPKNYKQQSEQAQIEKQFSIKKLLAPKTTGSPRSANAINPLTLSSFSKQN